MFKNAQPSSRPPGVPALAGVLVLLAAGAVGFFAFRGQPPLGDLAARVGLKAPWDDLGHPLMLAGQVCFLGVLLLGLAEVFRVSALRRRLARMVRLDEGGWLSRFFQECLATLRPRHAPEQFQQAVWEHTGAVRQAVTRRWRVLFLLAALPCVGGLDAALRAMVVNPAPRLAPIDYFLPLWIGSAESALGALLLYVGVGRQWRGLLSELPQEGMRVKLAPAPARVAGASQLVRAGSPDTAGEDPARPSWED
jgi:hypothetical protein